LAKRKIKNSVVTITGGTGSFGSTILSNLLAEGAGEVRVFSRDEAKQDLQYHPCKNLIGNQELKKAAFAAFFNSIIALSGVIFL
jgi:FlaA1/EpsC-like NDP-sugar epimerase